MRKPASFETLTTEQTELTQKLAAHLLSLRAATGMTQSQLAKAVGISRVHYGNMENGKVAVGWTCYLAFVHYFSLHPATAEMVREKELAPDLETLLEQRG